MRVLAVICLLATSACATAAPVSATNVLVQARDQLVLPNTERFEMKSASGRRFDIFIAKPQGQPPPEGWPVVYTLDANIMFGTVVDTARSYARRPGLSPSASVPSLVVGIGYPEDLEAIKERAADLTPSTAAAPASGAETGRAEQFISFLADELKPVIASRYKVDTSHETLFGHSYGGLFVLYSLVNRPDLFDTWLAASPSIWFEEGLLRKDNLRGRLQPKLEQTGATPRVLIMVGQFEEAADPDFPPPSLDRLISRHQVTYAKEFAEWLGAQKGVAVAFEILAEEDHGSVIPAAFARGMRFVSSSRIAAPGAAAQSQHPSIVAGIPVPAAPAYMNLSPDERYALRMKIRTLPPAERQPWDDALQYNLRAGLSYAQHRWLHEERQEMDKKHGTLPPDGD